MNWQDDPHWVETHSCDECGEEFRVTHGEVYWAPGNSNRMDDEPAMWSGDTIWMQCPACLEDIVLQVGVRG